MLNLSLDVHGVINKEPNYFSELFYINGDKGINFIMWDIPFNRLLSISDYHVLKGSKGLWFDEKYTLWMSGGKWNSTKAHLASINDIDFHIDDAKFGIYGKYFSTPYIYYDNKKQYLTLYYGKYREK